MLPFQSTNWACRQRRRCSASAEELHRDPRVRADPSWRYLVDLHIGFRRVRGRRGLYLQARVLRRPWHTTSSFLPFSSSHLPRGRGPAEGSACSARAWQPYGRRLPFPERTRIVVSRASGGCRAGRAIRKESSCPIARRIGPSRGSIAGLVWPSLAPTRDPRIYPIRASAFQHNMNPVPVPLGLALLASPLPPSLSSPPPSPSPPFLAVETPHGNARLSC